MKQADKAIEVLVENSTLPSGIFRVVSAKRVFPSRSLLNEFLLAGNDACDQDERMNRWPPFALSESEYQQVKHQWSATHPGTKEEAMGQTTWRDWTVELLERLDAS